MKKNIFYHSTRGNKEKKLSSEAIVYGIADDGGLFIPTEIPKIKADYNQLKELDYNELAYRIMKEYFTDFSEVELKDCIKKAYNKKFDANIITPLKKKMGVYFLELFHGPTLAFKDMALSILPYLLQISLKKLNLNKEIVILTATSGDTGKAALEGFANVPGTKIIVFFPQEGVSEIQKRQMLTQKGENAYVIGISGNFDNAQRGVKEIFENQTFKKKAERRNMILSSANSINIGRLVPQIVYYFYAYLKMLKENDIKAGEKINIVVPTGNFGNILAAYYAGKMGLPVKKLICASNDNKVLADFFKTGIYDRRRELIMTISPSMDILISSNLERLLSVASHGKADQINKIMNDLNGRGFYQIDPDIKKEFSDFYGECAIQEEAIQSIREVFKESEYLMDPHTAVGYAVYQKYLSKTKDITKTVIVATASPFKFTKSVMGAVDEKYKEFDDFELIEKMANLLQNPVPIGIKDIKKKSILHKAVCNKEKIKEKLAEILF